MSGRCRLWVCVGLYNILAALAGSAVAVAVAGPAATDNDAQRIADLVEANHILADQGISDGFGHLSVRSRSNPRHFFMSRARAPGQVARDDIVELDATGRPVKPLAVGWQLYGERAIHTAIYARRSDVQSVLHAHALAVLPFTFGARPFQPVIHQAYFLGEAPAPIYESRAVPGHVEDLLVTPLDQGDALATVLGQRPLVLMRGHGFTLVAPSVRASIFEAVYTIQNAVVLFQGLQLGGVRYLSRAEIAHMPDSLSPALLSRPWEAWVAGAKARLRQ